MSHKRDDLDALNSEGDGLQLFADSWATAVTDDVVDSSAHKFNSEFKESGLGSFDEFGSGLGLFMKPGSLPTSAPAVVNVTEGGTATIAGPGTNAVVFAGSSGTLVIRDSQGFHGEVSGLSGSDAIDLADLAYTAGTQATFVGTASGGTLTVSNGAETVKIALTGDYLSSTWSVSNDGNGGVSVVDPTVSANWQVMKVGAGGFADGLDEAPDGTIVVRTDTNGAYLWNGSSWQQLVTSSSMPAAFIAANPASSGQGVYEIQMAPSNSSVMYMLFDGYVFASTNKGATWAQTSFAQITEDANDSFRMYGQKMAVDPNNPNIVYVGTPQNGLWVTTNGGNTWTQVGAVPVSGTSSGQYPGITGIMFDPEIGGVVNGVTQTIFASSYGNGVYESTNGGSTWTKLSGGPSDVEYATVGPNGAYYAVGNGNTSLWRYYNGVWTELLNPTDGVQAVVINQQNPNEIVAVAPSGYLRISYDGGATWSSEPTPIVQSSEIPWEVGAQLTSSGIMYLTIGGAAFSKSNPNELILSTGTGSFDVMIPTSQAPKTLVYDDMSTGIENLSVSAIIAPPGGSLILASEDRPFIQITDLDDYPTTYGPVSSNQIVAGWSVDYASSTPSFLVGIADYWGVEESGYSTNGGATWTKFTTELPGAGSSFIGGTIAASTTQNFIWAPADGNQPYYTLDGGKTWNPITLPGISSWSGFDWAYYLRARTVTADRVLPNTFYLYYAGTGVFETTNGGQTWTEVHAGALALQDNFNAEIMAVPGEAGNLFWTGGIQGNGATPQSWAGFYFSSDQGHTWTAVPNVCEVFCFGFGAAAPGQTYPSIYIVGYVNNVYGVWQSTNKGQSWTQIGTQPAGELDQIVTISGDPNVFGRVYVGFNGGGYAYLSGGPYVTGVTTNPASGTESTGTTITFTVNMSEAVTVSGAKPTLTLNDGGTATYVSGSGSSALTFTYTVASSDTAVSALAISSTSLNGATIQDSSGNAGTLSGAVTTFSNISIASNAPVTVAYYLANEVTLDATGNVTISDTAANVASAFNALNSDSHVSAITLLGSTNLDLNVAQTLNDTHALNAITNSSYGITVTDTGANVAANFDALNADSHITTILPTDGSQTLTLTLTQMTNDTHALALLDPFEITVTGTAANLKALTTAQLTAFGNLNVTLLDATDADVALSQAQLQALSAAGISLEQPYSGGTGEVITYNAQGGIASIAYAGITGQQYTSYQVIYGSNGKPASAVYSNGMTTTWTYNASGVLLSVKQAGITGAPYTSYTVTYTSAGAIHDVAYTGVTGQLYTSFDVVYGANGLPASATYSNGRTTTWTYNSSGVLLSVKQAGITGATYTSYTITYTSAGAIHDIAYAGVTGQQYTSFDVVYGANGKPASATYSNGMSTTWTYNASGAVLSVKQAGITSAPYTSYTVTYTSAGAIHDVAYTGVTGAPFTSYDIVYGANGSPASATYSNGMSATWTYNADGSYDVVWVGVTNGSYSSYEMIANTAKLGVATSFNMTTGAGRLVLADNGLTTSFGSSAQTVTTGSDTFALTTHTAEAIIATGYSAETFGFTAGFGKDSITGFVAGGSSSDVLSLKLSMFSGLSASDTAAQNAAILLSSHAMAQSGSNVTITDTSGDVLTLMGTTTTALTQNASSIFKFS